MPDEPTTPPAEPTGEPTATTPAPSTTEGAPVAADAPGQAPVDAPGEDQDELEAFLSKHGDRLWQHPTVSSRVGNLAQKQARREIERFKQQWEAEQQRRAAEKAQQDLLELARTDPLKFSEQYLSQAEQAALERQINDLRAQTFQQFSQSLIATLKGLPELADLGPDEFAQLVSRAVSGKSDEEAVGALALELVEHLTGKRLPKAVEAEVNKRVAKEIEAARTEWEAERLKNGPAPDMRRASGHRVSNEPDYHKDPKAWNEWYERTFRLR